MGAIDYFYNKYFIFFLSCIPAFTVYYCLDIPSLMKGQFIAFAHKISPGNAQYYFNLSYTFYSFPNIFLPLISGALIDRMGYRLIIFVFTGSLLLGNFLTYIGFGHERLYLVLLGRLFSGFGAESLNVALKYIQVQIFKEEELITFHSIAMSLGRLGTSLQCYITPIVVKNRLDGPYQVAVILALISLVCTIILVIVDKAHQKSINTTSIEQHHQNKTQKKHRPFKDILRDVGNCKQIYWIYLAACLFYYLSYAAHPLIVPSYIKERWLIDSKMDVNTKTQRVGELLSIPPGISIIGFPICGWIADKFGKRISLMYISSTFIIVGYLSLLFINPVLALSCIGIAYGIFGSLMTPLVVYLVPHRIVATLLGGNRVVKNIAMTIFPVISAYMTTLVHGNLPSVVALLIFGVITLVLTIQIDYLNVFLPESLQSNNKLALIQGVETMYPETSLEFLRNQAPTSRQQDEEAQQDEEISRLLTDNNTDISINYNQNQNINNSQK